MGMKLKSGADLCGFQLTNFCVQGEASAPSDAALGRKYFHTNATDDVATGISLLHRERIYLGEGAWRATAYLDDIAAINEKLNLITGDTDTDTLINNLKDLEEFLKDFSETDKLKSLLDGKLDKSGGTIDSTSEEPLILNSTQNQVRVLVEKLGEAKSTIGWHNNYGTWIYDHKSQHSLGIKITDGTPFYHDGSFRTLIHSGNIGSQTVAAANALKLSNGTVVAEVHSDGRLYDKYNNALIEAGAASDATLTHYQAFGSANGTVVTVLQGGGAISLKTKNTDRLFINSSGNVTIGASDLAGTSAKLYVSGHITTPDYISFNRNNTERGYIGLAASGNANMYIWSAENANITAVKNLILNNGGGNVLIGTTRDNGARFQVMGNTHINSTDSTGETSINSKLSALVIGPKLSRSLTVGCYYPGITFNHQLNFNNTNSYNNSMMAWIGTKLVSGAGSEIDALVLAVKGSTDTDAVPVERLVIHPDGNTYITGNLIVAGEISAGGAGAEEGTSGSGSAEGVSEIFTPTSTSMAFDHNLGEDVIVQVYEKSGNVWNMVIVDTEITSATRVTLRFGKTETTQHKVVIMGV